MGGDVAVDASPCHFFQKRGTVRPFGQKEFGKAALCQKSGLREAFEVHPGDIFHLGGNFVQFFRQSFAFAVPKHMDGRLECSPGFFAGSVLAPAAAELSMHGAENDLGKAFACAARHDVVGAFAYLAQTGGTSVESQAYGIEYRAFARAGGAGDGEDAAGQEVFVSEVDMPFASQGIEVGETYAQDAHPSSPLSDWKNSSTASA